MESFMQDQSETDLSYSDSFNFEANFPFNYYYENKHLFTGIIMFDNNHPATSWYPCQNG